MSKQDGFNVIDDDRAIESLRIERQPRRCICDNGAPFTARYCERVPHLHYPVGCYVSGRHDMALCGEPQTVSAEAARDVEDGLWLSQFQLEDAADDEGAGAKALGGFARFPLMRGSRQLLQGAAGLRGCNGISPS